MNPDLALILSIGSPLLTMTLAAGGIIAFRSSLARTSSEIQERVINALQSEILSLRGKVESLEKANSRLSTILEIIQVALLKRSIHLTIDGEMVNIQSDGDHEQTMTRIK